MNDRFRFRIWDEENHILHILQDGKKYDCDSVEIAFDGSLIGTNFNDEIERQEHSISYLGGENCVLEQCTGLKDKNGKLIYEGDVVEAVVQNHYKLKGIICWEKDRYQIKELNAPVLFDLYEAIYDSDTGFAKNSIEVIGNIHENPELLEK